MPRPLAYPASRYAPSPLVLLSDAAERARLSAPAVAGFLEIMSHWQLRDDDARALLGGMAASSFY